MQVSLAKVTMIKPEPEDDEPTPAELPADPVAIATYQLAANVEKLRSTLKWVGGFVIVGLLIVAGNLR